VYCRALELAALIKMHPEDRILLELGGAY
jgi:hypothetical protein